MQFFDQIARYILNDKPVQELSRIAINGLEEEIDTPAMILLAGMKDDQSPFLYDEYFIRLLKELGISFLLDKMQSAYFLIKSTALGIVQHDIDVYEGCNTIFEHLLIYVEDKHLAGKYVYDNIGLSKVYSAYVTIEELTNATESWRTDKSNIQLINEIKIGIKTELVKWLITADNAVFKSSV